MSDPLNSIMISEITVDDSQRPFAIMETGPTTFGEPVAIGSASYLPHARLFAASVTMLATLKWLRDEYCEGGMLDGTEAEQRIIAAIAKAQGGAQ